MQATADSFRSNHHDLPCHNRRRAAHVLVILCSPVPSAPSRDKPIHKYINMSKGCQGVRGRQWAPHSLQPADHQLNNKRFARV